MIIYLFQIKGKYGRIISIIKYGKDRGEFRSIKYAQDLVINIKNSNFKFIDIIKIILIFLTEIINVNFSKVKNKKNR